MCGTSETRTQLPLIAASDHGCSCCSPAAGTRQSSAASSSLGSGTQATGGQYAVEGLTCGHCVQTVEKAVAGVPGVETATVELVPGGRSWLSVTGTAASEALAEAVRSSGYVLAGSREVL